MESLIYSIGAAVIGLGLLIVFHEFGHFLMAKLSGVGVLTFSVGFGPKIWVIKKGETEYALSAFPLGGYVKMVGEDPDEEVSPKRQGKIVRAQEPDSNESPSSLPARDLICFWPCCCSWWCLFFTACRSCRRKSAGWRRGRRPRRPVSKKAIGSSPSMASRWRSGRSFRRTIKGAAANR